jgi:hypothetical protein
MKEKIQMPLAKNQSLSLYSDTEKRLANTTAIQFQASMELVIVKQESLLGI